VQNEYSLVARGEEDMLRLCAGAGIAWVPSFPLGGALPGSPKVGQAPKPRNSPRTESVATAGTVNTVTRKWYLGDQYEPRTVRHGNAVPRSFYEYWIELGAGRWSTRSRSTGSVGGRTSITVP
jgi:aryl-alcohol dehydrogenase-like predicted oxidoreductase